ncbi:MAG: sulfotransferase [Gammaproteobacteria bacterium]|nr:sulfotransferase [Gammaproteobacteria bacterium]
MDMPESLQRAMHHLQSGRPADTLQVCNAILAEHPGMIQAHYLRGCAAFEIGAIEQSVSDLEIVHDNYPEHFYAAYYLGRALRTAGRLEEALQPLRAALAEDDLVVRAHYDIAVCLAGLRRRPDAIEHYEAILAMQPGNSQVAANMASLLERENRLEAAAAWTEKALSTDPGNEVARMTRATLDRRSGKYADAAESFRSLILSTANPVNRSIAWNQLGQCLEGQEKWGEAFDAFSESNQVLMKHHEDSAPDPRGPQSLQTLQRIDEWLRGEPIADWVVPATPDDGGIAFLVGFPRSGTTLLDRMLSRHPKIEVLEEKSLFSGLHQDWSAAGTLEALTHASDAQIIDARDIYRREMSRHRRSERESLVIDKLPLNLNYLFLIYRLFPDAPIIFLLRHPVDVCISCFFQAFELQASMAYFLDLGQTARYYDAAMRVASMSMSQIGSPMHRLRYEDLVVEPDKQVNGLFRFLGVEAQDADLQYCRQATDETSNTPSYQQVSQPLHARSVGKWRHYARQLDSILPVLRPWVERFGYQGAKFCN